MPATNELYIDESGYFEKFKEFREEYEGKKPVRLVGGIVVPPALKAREDDLRNELIEIGKDYYPDIKTVTDIHLSDKNLGPRRWELSEKLLLVLKEKMPEAKIAFIYNLEELDNDPQVPGAQLYRFMLVELLKTTVFYHPDFGADDHFDTKIASRRVPYPMGFDRDLASQGYLKLKDLGGKTEYTAITEADLISIMEQLNASLRFPNYRDGHYRIKPYAQWDNPFMVMADLVCNTVFHTLLKTSDLKKLNEELNKIFNLQKILFYCSSDYDFPANILEAYYKEKPGEFISKVIKRGISDLSDRFILIPAIDRAAKKIMDVKDPEECENLLRLADELLDARLFDKIHVIRELIKIAGSRLEKHLATKDYSSWDPVIYLYHDVALRLHNHTANVAQAIVHREKGQDIFKKIPKKDIPQIREYHEFVNRASVADTNEFAFERAICRLQRVKAAEEKLNEVLNIHTEVNNEILGKIYGSLAQNYAFSIQRDEAGEYFKKAAEQLGRENFLQTSYRAHLALDRRNRTYFDEMAQLFKQASFPGFSHCIEETLKDLASSAFNLHLLLKGMLIFFGEEGEGEKSDIRALALKVFDTLKSLSLFEGSMKEKHPWQLVFIVLGRFLAEMGNRGRALICWQSAANFSDDPEKITFIMIGHSARAWEARSWINARDINEARRLLSPITRTFVDLRDGNYAPGIFNPKKLVDFDGEFRPGWFDDVGQEFLKLNDRADDATLERFARDFISRFTFNYW